MDNINEKVYRNRRINLIKGIACMVVVFIHINFPGKIGLVIKDAASFAVPFFFMVAGYYAYNKDERTIRRRLHKIIRIFVFAYFLYFISSLLFSVINHKLGFWLKEQFNWLTPLKYIAFCTVDFAVPLWYLIAMIEVYLVWLYIVKKNKEIVTLKVIPYLFALSLLLTITCETLDLEWFWKTNFLTRGMPWFLMGYYLNTERAGVIRGLSNQLLFLISLFGCVIAIVPTALGLKLQFNAIGYIPFAIGLFCIAIKSGESIFKPLEFIGDHLSLYIYIFHVFIGRVLGFFCTKLLRIDTNSQIYLWISPIVVLLLSVLWSLMIYLFRNKRLVIRN